MHKQFCQEYIKNGGNAKEAVKTVWGKDTYTKDRVKCKGYELMNNKKIQNEINKISAKNGLDLDGAMEILNGKVKKEAEIKALNLWFDVTGNKAPTKSETKADVTHNNVTEIESDLINEQIRRNMENRN